MSFLFLYSYYRRGGMGRIQAACHAMHVILRHR
jgi:hypothetical protein